MANSEFFETAADILKTMNLQYDYSYEKNVQTLFSQWIDIVGENLAKYSSPQRLTENGILFVCCKNSIVANELFNNRTSINKIIKTKAKELYLNDFKYIKITYKSKE